MKRTIALGIKGKLTFCPTHPTLPCGPYVFQGVKDGLGNVQGYARKNLQLRRWVKPYDPKTGPQKYHRQQFAFAVFEWQTLTPEQKKSWKIRGKADGLPGYNAFIRDYIRSREL